MKIEIEKNSDETRCLNLLKELITLNQNSDFNYFDRDNIFIGENFNSGFAYCFLESSPSVCLCFDDSNNLCIVYSSALDGIEFINYNIPETLSKLEDIINDAYALEDETRGDDYNNDKNKSKFIDAMLEKGWEEL